MNEAQPIQQNGKEPPAYRRIQNAIRQRIESGQLRPGDVVDSERELAKLHSVSLMTARHALAGLAHEGVVERRHGAGTFVSLPKIHFNKLLSYTEQMSSLGLAACSRIVSSGIVNREQEIAARLGLPSNSKLVRIERVRSAGDEPVAHEVCYLSGEEFPTLMDVPLDQASLFAVLERQFGVELAYADEEIDATQADHRVAELLQISRGSALLRIRQLIFSTQNSPTIYVNGHYRSGRHTLRVRRFR